MTTPDVIDTSDQQYRLLHGDCRQQLLQIATASIHAIVTDPPYELGFMGKRWDSTGIAYDQTVWSECLRVLKPGGHLLAFGGTRTYHRMACAIEDAGFQIRDSIHWLYRTGFPKSLNVSKAIDKAAGAEREVIQSVYRGDRAGMSAGIMGHAVPRVDTVTAPATDAASQWEGWGTALKPAHEPIIVARKPLDGTVAANVLAHGTGALNIDGCRIGDGGGTRAVNFATKDDGRLERWDEGYRGSRNDIEPLNAGRWPANVVIDPHIAEQHPEWANYYYCPKASTTERNTGLNDHANRHPTVKPLALMRWLCRLVTPPGGTVLDPFAGSGTTMVAAITEGFRTIGIEMTSDYTAIIEARIAHIATQPGQITLI